MKTFALILALSSSVSGFATFDMKCDGEAKYKVMFTGTWTAENHPVAYPGAGLATDPPPQAHFSPLTGATFPYGSEFFKAGGMAIEGVKNVAETGNNEALISYLEANPMTYTSIMASAGGAFTPWKMMIEVTADEMHDHLGLATMIAPSPDWFTGAPSLELCDYETGMWKEEVTHMAMAYDAGTDAGTTFTADDMMEDSAKPISMIACGEFDAFCDSGDMMPVATITVTKMVM